MRQYHYGQKSSWWKKRSSSFETLSVRMEPDWLALLPAGPCTAQRNDRVLLLHAGSQGPKLPAFYKQTQHYNQFKAGSHSPPPERGGSMGRPDRHPGPDGQTDRHTYGLQAVTSFPFSASTLLVCWMEGCPDLKTYTSQLPRVCYWKIRSNVVEQN